MSQIETIFDKSSQGRVGIALPPLDVPKQDALDSSLLREKKAALPELSEFDVVRHFTNLSNKNFSIDRKVFI